MVRPRVRPRQYYERLPAGERVLPSTVSVVEEHPEVSDSGLVDHLGRPLKKPPVKRPIGFGHRY